VKRIRIETGEDGSRAFQRVTDTGCGIPPEQLGSIFTPWALVWGALPVGVALTIWFWPQRPRSQTGPLRVRSR
jgi:K+-sensing histidine kinase KdpD